MRISRFLLSATFLTTLALFYVWQQTEVFRLAYTGQKSLIQCQDLLDKNTLLRYNIDTQISLTQLGDRISQDRDFQMPGTYRLVKSATSAGPLVVTLPNLKHLKQKNLVARIFGIRDEAEAKDFRD